MHTHQDVVAPVLGAASPSFPKARAYLDVFPRAPSTPCHAANSPRSDESERAARLTRARWRGFFEIDQPAKPLVAGCCFPRCCMDHPSTPRNGRSASARSSRLSHAPVRALRVALVGLCLTLVVAAGAAVNWDPINPADLAAKDSTTNPGADAEILFERHELSGKDNESLAYVRAKIYTARGVEMFGRVEVPATAYGTTPDVQARVLKTDGSIHEIRKEDIFTTTVWKTKFSKQKVTRVAFPNLAPGDIVEYRWRRHSDWSARWGRGRWELVQNRVPTREASYTYEEIAESFIGWTNLPAAEEKRRVGFYTVTLRNLPAFEAEEYMPPEREFRGWLFQVPTYGEKNHEVVWRRISEWNGMAFGEDTAPSGPMKEAAKAAIGDATTDDEKLRRLYEFCQSEITNLTWSDTPELQAVKDKNRPDDDVDAKRILARRFGWPSQVNEVFAALARSAGYDARLAYNAGVDELLNVRTPRGWAFMDREHVVVRVGAQWRHFDPGSYVVPYGMLSWRDEGAAALICDKQGRDVEYHEAPRSPATASRAFSKGKFELSADGTLEGEVEMSWTGHLAIIRKALNWEDSQEDVDKDFRDEANKLLPDAEISNLTWENLRNRTLPLFARFHVRVPGYAEAVGRRLLVRPAFFSVGDPIVFAAATRKYPIAFPFAQVEAEEVSIRLPEGYELEQPSAPRNVGTPDSDFWAKYTIKFGSKTRTLVHGREFALGGAGATMFQAQSYPVLKGLFEELHRSDTHAIMVRPKPAAEAAPAASAVGAAATP